MIQRTTRAAWQAKLALVAIALLSACSAAPPTGSEATASEVPVAAGPGEPLGALPGVDGVSYRAEDGAVPGFLEGANETLAGAAEVRIVQAAIATHGSEQVSLIAFAFPGAADAAAVDYFARVLDGMEDGFGAGSQRGLGGGAYVMTGDGQSVVLGPWGRTAGQLVFLFATGPSGITEQLAAAILGVEG